MEGIDGNAIVRVRVRPRMRHGGIIDRQNLNYFLAGANRPVDHAFQITEITYSKAFSDFNENTGTATPAPFHAGMLK